MSDEPEPIKPPPAQRPRDRIRAYAYRELSSIEAWEQVLAEEKKPLYPRMVEDRLVLKELVAALDAREDKDAKR